MRTRKPSLMVRRIALGATALAAVATLAISVAKADFIGPSGAGGVGNGAIATDANNNVSIGSQTVNGDNRLSVFGRTTTSAMYAVQAYNSAGTSLFSVRNDGATNVQGTLTVNGAAISGTATAANVSSGQFGANTGGGNYSFPSEVRFNGDAEGNSYVKLSASGGEGFAALNIQSNQDLTRIVLSNSSGYANTVLGTGDGWETWFMGQGVGVGCYATANSYKFCVGNGGNGGEGGVDPLFGVRSDGGVGLQHGSAAAPILSAQDDPNTGIFWQGSDIISIATGGTKRLTIRSDGGVGLGVDAPSGRLDLGSGALYFANNSTDSCAMYSQYIAGSRQVTFGSNGCGTTEYWLFSSAGGGNLMKIQSNGNIGIGTTTPAYKLSVAGTIHSSSGGFRFPDGTTQTTAASGSGTISAANVSSGSFGANTGGGNYSFPASVGIGVSPGSTGLDIQYAGTQARFAYNISEGKVFNIAVTSAGPTQISSQGTYIDTVSLGAANYSTNYPVVGYNVKFTGSSESYQYKQNGYASAIQYGAASGNMRMRFLVAGSGSSNGAISWTEAMSILNSNGNVGIGNADPQYKLSVAGTIHSSSGGFRFPDGTTQTTAASGSGTISAANVSSGSFGANTGGGNYSFPGTVTLSTSASGNLLSVGTTGSNAARIAASTGSGIAGINFTSNSNTWFLDNRGSNDGSLPANRLSFYNNAGTELASFLQAGSFVFNPAGISGTPNFVAGDRIVLNDTGSATSSVTWARSGVPYVRVYYTTSGSSLNFDFPQGSSNVNINNASLTVGGGTGKLNVGTIDPIYQIGGEKFATYMPGIIGVKEEVAGDLDVPCADGRCVRTIDFAKEQQGSDLWLFGKVTDIRKHLPDASILLTPAFDGRVSYQKGDGTVTIIATPFDKHDSVEVSYRFTAPRFDADAWSNRTTDEAAGFIIP